MIEYSYKVLTDEDDAMLKQLNESGELGWELIFLGARTAEGRIGWFKRRKNRSRKAR